MVQPAQIRWLNESTPYSLDFEDVYYSQENGLDESRCVFLESQNIEKRFCELSKLNSDKRKHFSILECGFGTGLNFFLTLQSFLPFKNDFKLIYTAVEAFPLPLVELKKVWKVFNLDPNLTQNFEKIYPPCYGGVHPLSLKNQSCELNLFFMPLSKALDEFIGKVDAIYLDGFSPQKNPEMWDMSSFKKFNKISKNKETTLSSFTSAGWVRRGLEEAGFRVNKVKGFQKKREMITGLFMEGPTQDEWIESWNSLPQVQSFDSIKVIGGGISGCSLAYEFSQNKIAVEVIEKEPRFMNGASGNPYAIVMPMIAAQDNPVLMCANQSFLYSRGVYAEASVFEEVGAFKFPRFDEGSRQEKFFKNFYNDSSFAKKVSSSDFKEWTGISSPVRECVFFPQAGMVQPNKIFDFIKKNNFNNITWSHSSDFNSSLFSSLRDIPVFFAHSSGIKECSLLSWLPLRSVRGQVALIKKNEINKNKLNSILAYEGYLTPLRNGFHLLGASYDWDNLDLSLREYENIEMINQLNIKFGLSYLASDVCLSQSSLRLAASDHLPVFGAIPELGAYCETFKDYFTRKSPKFLHAPYIQSFFLMTAMGSRGFSMAPYCARVLSALLLGEPLPIQKSLFRSLLPQRFILRHLKRLLKT